MPLAVSAARQAAKSAMDICSYGSPTRGDGLRHAREFDQFVSGFVDDILANWQSTSQTLESLEFLVRTHCNTLLDEQAYSHAARDAQRELSQRARREEKSRNVSRIQEIKELHHEEVIASLNARVEKLHSLVRSERLRMADSLITGAEAGRGPWGGIATPAVIIRLWHAFAAECRRSREEANITVEIEASPPRILRPVCEFSQADITIEVEASPQRAVRSLHESSQDFLRTKSFMKEGHGRRQSGQENNAPKNGAAHVVCEKAPHGSPRAHRHGGVVPTIGRQRSSPRGVTRSAIRPPLTQMQLPEQSTSAGSVSVSRDSVSASPPVGGFTVDSSLIVATNMDSTGAFSSQAQRSQPRPMRVPLGESFALRQPQQHSASASSLPEPSYFADCSRVAGGSSDGGPVYPTRQRTCSSRSSSPAPPQRQNQIARISTGSGLGGASGSSGSGSMELPVALRAALSGALTGGGADRAGSWRPVLSSRMNNGPPPRTVAALSGNNQAPGSGPLNQTAPCRAAANTNSGQCPPRSRGQSPNPTHHPVSPSPTGRAGAAGGQQQQRTSPRTSPVNRKSPMPGQQVQWVRGGAPPAYAHQGHGGRQAGASTPTQAPPVHTPTNSFVPAMQQQSQNSFTPQASAQQLARGVQPQPGHAAPAMPGYACMQPVIRPY
eukprot:gnl/TRDRNA2_/TRDRNA2_39930_c0_seq1.p1 gnl/TRDRNA2_/TRDRNA2_39930_c0~~gnl/TRDRNA2_/TRDRNA2_39930_c0_seq1.p1  ORF type:complete len:719 (+),score=111.04 gnl/TRDRNA2_/TRDRNA2_39930_c0_seq1:164-2158(+)